MSRIKNKSAISCAVLDIEPTRTPFQGREKVVEEIKKNCLWWYLHACRFHGENNGMHACNGYIVEGFFYLECETWMYIMNCIYHSNYSMPPYLSVSNERNSSLSTWIQDYLMEQVKSNMLELQYD